MEVQRVATNNVVKKPTPFDLNGQGNPKSNSLKNIGLILSQDSILHDTFKYNEFAYSIDVVRDIPELFIEKGQMDDSYMAMILRYIEDSYNIMFQERLLTMGITVETISTYLSAKNDLPLYDNFDEATLDPNGNPVPGNDYWRAERLLGDDACLVKWSIDANNYENATPYLCTTSINTTPWSSVVTSPFLTSEDADKLYVSFYTGYTLVNTPDQDLDSDYLDVEYALDGENWITVKSICADDLDPYSWNFFKVDLDKSLTGKPIRHEQNRRIFRP